MFELVDFSEVRRYRSICSEILTEVRDTLREENGIVTQFTLVGSGARNLVTRNGDGPYDLDYNLYIVNMPEHYWNDLADFKDKVRQALNHAVQETAFSDGSDSTSVLTALLHFKDTPDLQFSFDIAILAQNENGTWCRLIHNKNARGFGPSGQYTWCEIPRSKDVREKARIIKSDGKWQQVREKYVELKNLYLQRNDKNHPSFICYVEAVNEIYHSYH